MASIDKFGAAFAIGFMAVMLGIMGVLASDTTTSDRPGADQQAAVSPPPMPKPVIDKDAMIGSTTGPGSGTIKEAEYCWVEHPDFPGEKIKDGVDNDMDGLIDEPDTIPSLPLGPHPGVDWDYCNLDGYDFTGANLEGATIRHASAERTNFSETRLNEVQFGHDPADFEAEHPHTDATRAIFDNSAGKNVTFERTTLNEASFDNAKLPGADFNHAGMDTVSMERTYVPQANFVFANVIHSDLRNIESKFSDMTHVNLESTDLSNGFLIGVTFDEALLVDAQFVDANMKDSSLCNVDASNDRFSADVITSFESANMQNTVISGEFNFATFEDADLTNASWNDCDPALIDISIVRDTNFHNAEFMEVYIPCGMDSCPPGETDFEFMISNAGTDKSCLHHPFCDLEPIPHGDDTSPPPPPPEHETSPESSAPMELIIEAVAGSYAPGCEETDECYSPSYGLVAEGGTIIFRNADTAAHTMTSGGPAEVTMEIFDTSLIMAGYEYSFTLDAGEYPYFCMVHPWMSGTIEVVP